MRLFALIISLSVLVAQSLYAQDDNVYVIETTVGNIKLEVYPGKAPITVQNFIDYVELNAFENADFFRVVRLDNQPNDSVKIEVIQGNFTDSAQMLPPIAHETNNKTGLLHKDGTVSMARTKPGTASLSFFICINDQPELDYGGKRNADGTGFAAFGQVIEGMDVVRKIQAGKTMTVSDAPFLWNSQMLKKKPNIKRIYKAE